MVLNYNVTLGPDTVVMCVNLMALLVVSLHHFYCVVRVWISSDHVAAVAEKGFRIVHAASNYFYLVRSLLYNHILGH